MTNRWTSVEEAKLLKLIASGKTYKELCGGFNRSENALELRLKKIIYDNINNKKSIAKISELLHMNQDIIIQYYYSYKDYVEKQQHTGGNNNNNNDNNNKSIINNEIIISDSKISNLNNLSNLSNLNINNNDNNNNNNLNNNNLNNNNLNNNKLTNLNNNIQLGGNKINKLDRLEQQNNKMKLILENYMLKHKISKLLRNKHNDSYKDAINALIK